ncbi:uncharacterized protein N7443_006841 [Penicillium atrosanguineum]|uniref:uncharacterized protein n=1 Tax=Penicillium atrosanguineum TaxID=1132637 RepID=UPI002383B49D|nr:uncharacterized protein N7443_006841 [Penicillium atrosanguineum]KAJ5298721.1 hypothetical protein N7443_006841 [Penicillium atrosanguineum]
MLLSVHGRREDDALRVGSVKTNIGHTEATSGLASVIKVVMAMEKGVLPPSINFEKPNSQFDLDHWRLKVPTELKKRPVAPGQTMRASVNNFGYGGSNAHVIMEDANRLSQNRSVNGKVIDGVNKIINGVDAHATGTTGDKHKLLIVSAKDDHAHENMVARLAEFLRQKEPSRSAQRPRIGMVFTGQGAQSHALGRKLITAYPVYKASLEEADGYLRDLGASWSLMEELGRDIEASKVNMTAFSIPICAAVQIALVRLLETWGIKPSAVTSHSSGEIAATYTVGAISLRLAMGIAYYRSRLAAEVTLNRPIKGSMLAVGLGHLDVEQDLERLTGDARAVVACINSPSSTTVAGKIAAIEELETLLTAEDVFARRLRVDTAYYSHHMEPVAESYRQALCKMPTDEPKTKRQTCIAFASPVGSLMQPVQFVDAFIEMVQGDLSVDAASHSVDIIVEIGPHTALGGPIQEILTLEDFEGIKLPYYGSLVRHAHAVESLQILASNLLKEGYALDIEAANFPQGRSQNRDHPPHELRGSLVPGTNPETPVWRHILRATEPPWVQDHVIQSKMLYPGCEFICLAVEAAMQQLEIAEEQEDCEISGYQNPGHERAQALVIPDTAGGIEIQTALRLVSDKAIGLQDWKEFGLRSFQLLEVFSITSENRWMRHAQGLVMVEFNNVQNGVSSLDQEIQNTRKIDPIEMWSTLEPLGIKYGPIFRNISDIHVNLIGFEMMQTP